jgi:hypothetical protein
MPLPQETRVCPHCSFAYRSRQGRCWLCGEPLPPIDQAPLAVPRESPPLDAEIVENPYAAPPAGVVGGWTFGLSSLFLIVTLAAVCLGVIGLAPGLGVPLLVVAVLALVRTLAVSRRQADAHGLTTGEKIAAFVGSAGIVILILIASGIAFLTACWVSCFGASVVSTGDQVAVMVGLVVGVAAALVLTVVLFRATWPKWRVPPGKKEQP